MLFNSLDSLTRVGYTSAILNNYIYIGRIYIANQKFELADSSYQAAKKVCESLKKPFLLGQIYIWLSSLEKQRVLVEGNNRYKVSGLNYAKLAISELQGYRSNINLQPVIEKASSLKSFFEGLTGENIQLYHYKYLRDKSTDFEVKIKLQKLILDVIGKEYSMDSSKPNLQAYIDAYGEMSYYLLFKWEFFKSRFYVEKGLKLDPNKVELRSNLILSYIFQGDFRRAKKEYSSLEKIYISSETLCLNLLEKIKILESYQITHPKVRKLKKLLKG